mmetsp:Transcript_26144/g.60484  ORF Transcript_26144/g.60484 Transcript_26144/m.60484 type:complete len:124 (-) Transcript_26144:186-557(-)
MFPESIDASVTKHAGNNVSESEMLMRIIGPPRYLARGTSAYLRHKVIMDIDGNVQANRFPELVLAGSVVIQATKFELPLAAPCSCIFSVRPDLSDLLPTLACLRAHENLTLARVKHGAWGGGE